MRIVRRAGRAAVAVAVTFCFCAAAQAEGVLDQVPADAWVVIRVNRLEQTNKKVAAWAEAMGIAQMHPDAADPLGALERETNLKGIDKSKDLAICVLDPAVAGGQAEKSILILVPTNDYKALAASLPNSKTEGDLTKFNDGDGEDSAGFAMKWGDYAAVSPTQAILSKKPGGLKLSGLSAKEMQKDAVVYANIPALRAKVLPELKKLREQAKKELQQQARGGNADGAAADVKLTSFRQQPARRQPAQPGQRPAQQPARRAQPAPAAPADDAAGDPAAAAMKQWSGVLSAVIDQYFNAAERFLTDGSAATFSLNFGDGGLNTTLAAEFTQGSYLGKIVGGIKNTDGPLLAGLPGDRKYFAFGGFANSPEPLNQIVSDFVDPVLKQLAGAGQGGQNVRTLLEAVKKSIQNTKTTTMGYPAATGALGTESIIQSVAISTGNAKAIAEAQKTILKGMNSLFQNMPQAAAAGGAQPKVSLEIQEGAKTVAGAKLDQYKINMDIGEPDSPQAAQAQQMMAMVYGPNGMSGVLGPVNDTTFVAVQGGTDQLVQQVVESARNPQDKLSALGPVKAAGSQLPKSRFGVFYLQLDQVITSGVKYAQGFGVPIKMQLPPNLPPIGFSASTEGTAVRFDTHVPTNTIQSIVAAGMQAYMQMQGGGAGAPGAPEGL